MKDKKTETVEQYSSTAKKMWETPIILTLPEIETEFGPGSFNSHDTTRASS